MAKIVITAALFLAMVAMASAYTTITTTVMEEENTRTRRGGEMCQQQFKDQQHLNMCKMFLQQAQPYAEEAIEMVGNPMRGDEEQMKMQCCNQLENMNEECRCQALRMMAMEGQQSRRQMGRQMGDMSRMAMEIPRMCSMAPYQC